MGYFNNKYPYTDLEQLNLDWVIKTINQVDTDLTGIREECEAIAEEKAQAVADELTATVNEKIAEVNQTVANLREDFENAVAELEGDYSDFVILVNGKINDMQNEINALESYIDDKVAVSDALTDTKIARNNTYIFDVITHELVPQLTVTDYFSGNQISIQQMFDQLAQLHVTDSLTYAQLLARNKTYTDISNLNITYQQLLMNGNSLVI